MVAIRQECGWESRSVCFATCLREGFGSNQQHKELGGCYLVVINKGVLKDAVAGAQHVQEDTSTGTAKHIPLGPQPVVRLGFLYNKTL